MDSEWQGSENRFEFPCGCVFYRRYRTFRGENQWRLEQEKECAAACLRRRLQRPKLAPLVKAPEVD